MLTIKNIGNFDKTINFLRSVSRLNYLKILQKYGEIGVIELSKATPKDTGLTSTLWSYKIVKTKSGIAIQWLNSNIVSGVPIALILQYGHATSNGGFVYGVDYINPALKKTFENIAIDISREVKAL